MLKPTRGREAMRSRGRKQRMVNTRQSKVMKIVEIVLWSLVPLMSPFLLIYTKEHLGKENALIGGIVLAFATVYSACRIADIGGR